MFGSTVLEVGTALLFIFLTLSIVVSSVNELVARVFELRAGFLREALTNLLEGGRDGEAVEKFYAHPLVKSLGRSKDGKLASLPSYLPTGTFARVLVDLLADDVDATPSAQELTDRAKKLGGASLEGAVKAILRETGNDFVKFRKGLEGWFDDVMDRVSGWYARRTRVIATFVAAGIVVGLNADAIALTNRLYTDADLRAKVVAAADATADAPPPEVNPDATEDEKRDAATAIVQSNAALEEAGIMLGWNGNMPKDAKDWLMKVFGWLLTIAATVMGAPFWFDLLGRIVSIRASGTRPVSPANPARPAES